MRKRPTSKRKPGRPKGDRKPLGTITIRIDDATIAAIDKLAAACPPGTLYPRSTAIRTALIEAAGRLGGKGRR